MSTALSESDLKEKVGPPLGKIANGVYIVTTRDGEEFDGMLATWICQSSFSPPVVSVAINKSRHIASLLEKNSEFAVNILSKENMDIFKNFAKPVKTPEEAHARFTGLDRIEHAGPPVFKKAIGYLICKVHTVVDSGDHNLVLGEITNGSILNPELESMIHIRKNGFQY
jgi:flavin reductase (DIM6/NTAB) family NADH-FMN oxidoreductase RutF